MDNTDHGIGRTKATLPAGVKTHYSKKSLENLNPEFQTSQQTSPQACFGEPQSQHPTVELSG